LSASDEREVCAVQAGLILVMDDDGAVAEERTEALSVLA